MRLPPLRRILADTWKGYNEHRVSDLAAMLTYYVIFALFPFIIFLVTLTLLILPKDVLENGFTMLAVALPREVRLMALENLHRIEQAAGGGFAIVSFLIALWGASRAAAALETSLNLIHDVKETRPWWKVQVVAIITTIAVSGLILVALALLLFGPLAGHWLMDRFGLSAEVDLLISVGRWVGAAGLVMFVWGCLYYYLPNRPRPFRWVTLGATVAVLLWLAASRAFIFFVEHFSSYDKTYGALAAVIVTMTWIWISCLTLLIGGEVDDAIEDWRTEQLGVKEIPLEKTRSIIPPPAQETGMAGLIKRVGDDITTLAKNHYELARTELSTSMKAALVEGGAILLGAIVGLIGLAMLCVTLVVAAEPLLPMLWVRLFLGAILYMALGSVVILVCVKRLKGGQYLEKTKEEVGRTTHLLEERMQHG